VLDGVVDAALAAGALGSSLTGAGLAGSVLALTRTEDEEFVADHVRSWLSGEAYAAASGNAPLSAEAAEEAVLRNVSPAGAAPFSL
jgi:galactokinase